MEYKCNKQFWLENVLKKLNKKVHSLRAKNGIRRRGNRQKKKLKVSTTNFSASKNQKKEKRGKGIVYQSAFRNQRGKREKSKEYQIVTRSRKQKSLLKKNIVKQSKKKHSKYYGQKFWKFVDTFLQSKSFLSRRKNAIFIPVIPSTVNNTLLNRVGNTLTLRSRVVSRQTCNKSSMSGNCGEEGFLKSEITSVGDRKVLAQKIYFTIQRARMKRATDIIAKEVMNERKSKKTLKKHALNYCM